MTARSTNLAILVLLLLELASGVAGFLVATPSGRWVFWLHSTAGFTLLLLVVWKWRVILGSFAHRTVGPWAMLPAMMTLLFVASLTSGLLWATVGLPPVRVPLVGRTTGLTLHVALSLALVPLFVYHLAVRWPRPRRVDVASRRAALRLMALALLGAVAWRGTEAASAALALSGARRRFTGSRQRDSHEGNRHPVTNWLTDRTQRVRPDQWRLSVRGEVETAVALTYEELIELGTVDRVALLDCTGGWYTVQRWSGVPLAELLRRSRVGADARSVVVRSRTGYARRFGLDAARDLLLATHVEGERLSAAHGFPVRLVAPGRRGYHWVKWVESVEVSAHSPWWQSPLPLQ